MGFHDPLYVKSGATAPRNSPESMRALAPGTICILFTGGPQPPITLVNSFEVPAGRENEFFTLWKQVNTYMRQKPGYLEHKLHRSLAPDAPFRFINIARWASQEDFDAAHDEGFRALVTQPAWAAFRSRPALYEVVHEAQADGLSKSLLIE
jgi:heme-degrading monooxygenase HmoA